MTPNGKPPQNSKSLVLITRVGSTPTTGIKRKLPQTSWGSFLFLSAACAVRTAHAQSPKKSVPILSGRFFFICGTLCVRRQFCSALFRPCRECFLPPVFIAAVLPGISGNDRLFCRKVVLYPRKKHQNPAPAIYSTVSYRFYNVFYEKGFTNEFQKHII